MRFINQFTPSNPPTERNHLASRNRLRNSKYCERLTALYKTVFTQIEILETLNEEFSGYSLKLPQLKRDVKRLGLKRYKRRAHKAISPEPSVVDDSRNDENVDTTSEVPSLSYFLTQNHSAAPNFTALSFADSDTGSEIHVFEAIDEGVSVDMCPDMLPFDDISMYINAFLEPELELLWGSEASFPLAAEDELGILGWSLMGRWS